MISVCILAGHGPAALEACFASLAQQSSPPPFEVLVGGDPPRESLAIVRRHLPDARFYRTGRLLPGAARNPLVERAAGELLLFLDDDVTAPPDLLQNLASVASRYPGADVFGGPNDTPRAGSRFQAVQGAVLSSLLGSGPVARRYGARHGAYADERWFTLCNLAVRRTAMTPFLRDLTCAEENALLCELRRDGSVMRYEPVLRVFHERRPSWTSFARQMMKYGRGRGELLRRDPRAARSAYLAPSALLVYLVVLPAYLAVGGLSAVALLPGALYAVLAGVTAGRIGWTLRRLADVPLALGLIMTLHGCYGWGVMHGLVRGPRQVDPVGPRLGSIRRATSPAPRVVRRAAGRSVIRSERS